MRDENIEGSSTPFVLRERRCYECKKPLRFESYLATNSDIEEERLIFLWQHKNIEILCCSCLWKYKDRESKKEEKEKKEKIMKQIPMRRCSRCDKEIVYSEVLKKNPKGTKYMINLTRNWPDFTKRVYCKACVVKEREANDSPEIHMELKRLQKICKLWRCGKMKAGELVEELGLEGYNFKLLVDGERITEDSVIKLGEEFEILLEKPVQDYSDLVYKLIERSIITNYYGDDKVSQVHQRLDGSLPLVIGMWKVSFS